MTTALFVTRAQPFHLGHLKVIRDMLRSNRNIVIVIGSAQAKNTKKNPFSANEREEMINRALKDEKINNYEVVRVSDVFDDQLWVAGVKKVCRFDVVYSMNPWTARCFKKAGIEVRKHMLYSSKSCSGTEIRKRMIKNQDWEKLVPRGVAEYIKGIDGMERVKKVEKAK